MSARGLKHRTTAEAVNSHQPIAFVDSNRARLLRKQYGWHTELFFQELKSTFGFAQSSFQRFESVKAWVEMAITAVLFLEHERA